MVHFSLSALAAVVFAYGAAAATYRDNDVTLSFRDMLGKGYSQIGGSYQIKQYRITDGQDNDNHIGVDQTRQYFGNDGTISFSIGRKGSGTVRDWWKERIRSDQNSFGHDPDDLNFAFLGTLSVTLVGGDIGSVPDTFVLQNIALAQGHSGSSNNWWFGGQSCNYRTGTINTVTCPAIRSNGQQWNFIFERDGGTGVSEVRLEGVIRIL